MQATEVALADTPARWQRQDWGQSNGRENLHRVGGEPSWIQSPWEPLHGLRPDHALCAAAGCADSAGRWRGCAFLGQWRHALRLCLFALRAQCLHHSVHLMHGARWALFFESLYVDQNFTRCLKGCSASAAFAGCRSSSCATDAGRRSTHGAGSRRSAQHSGGAGKSIIFKRKLDGAAVLVVTSGDKRVDEKR